MSENLTRAENYLSLVGLVVLILGGIGVSSVTRVFVQQKVRSIAILKCVGSTHRAGAERLPGAGAAAWSRRQRAGRGVAGGVLMRCRSFVGDLAALLARRVRARPLARSFRGWRSACWCRCCFRWCRCSRSATSSRRCCCGRTCRRAAVRLVEVGRRRGGGGGAGGRGRLAGGVARGRSRAVRADSSRWRSCCTSPASALVRAVQPLRHARSFALRHAVLHVARPGEPDARHSARRRPRHVLHPRRARTPGESAERFLAADRRGRAGHVPASTFSRRSASGVTALVDARTARTPAPMLIPVLRARVVGVRGRDVNLESYEDVRGRGGLAREFTVTYRSQPRGEREARSRAVVGCDAGRADSPRSRSRRASASAFQHSASATRCASTCSAAWSPRASPASARVNWPRLPCRRLHVRLPAGCVRRRAAHVHRRGAGPRRIRPPARACRRLLVGQLSERVGHRPA